MLLHEIHTQDKQKGNIAKLKQNIYTHLYTRTEEVIVKKCISLITFLGIILKIFIIFLNCIKQKIDGGGYY